MKSRAQANEEIIRMWGWPSAAPPMIIMVSLALALDLAVVSWCFIIFDAGSEAPAELWSSRAETCGPQPRRFRRSSARWYVAVTSPLPSRFSEQKNENARFAIFQVPATILIFLMDLKIQCVSVSDSDN